MFLVFAAPTPDFGRRGDLRQFRNDADAQFYNILAPARVRLTRDRMPRRRSGQSGRRLGQLRTGAGTKRERTNGFSCVLPVVWVSGTRTRPLFGPWFPLTPIVLQLSNLVFLRHLAKGNAALPEQTPPPPGPRFCAVSTAPRVLSLFPSFPPSRNGCGQTLSPAQGEDCGCLTILLSDSFGFRGRLPRMG